MATFNILEGMKRIGEFDSDGALPAAACTKVTGDNTFAVQSDGTAVSTAFSVTASDDGDKADLAWGPGGLIVTDNVNATGTPAAGDFLGYDHVSGQFKKDASLASVLQILAVDGDDYRCKALI